MFKPSTYALEMLEQTKRLNVVYLIPEISGFVTQ